jgi:predicted membrane-bound spermidine synthase
MAFPVAAKLDVQGVAATASRLYTADYIGACLGALLVSTLLIPLLGVATVCLLTAGLAIWSAALLAVTSR